VVHALNPSEASGSGLSTGVVPRRPPSSPTWMEAAFSLKASTRSSMSTMFTRLQRSPPLQGGACRLWRPSRPGRHRRRSWGV